MKFSEFLAENNVSYYKLAQLGGSDPAKYSGALKLKITNGRPLFYTEYQNYCQKLSDFLHKDVRPEMFDCDVYKIKLK